MIAVVYGRAFAPLVEPVARDLAAAAARAGGQIRPLSLEAALADRRRCADVHRVHVLPFDPPAATDLPPSPAALIRALFPRAEISTSFAVQDLCWDKLATQERLLDRGVPVPETVVATEPAEVCEFVRRHQFAVLKERHSCAGQGHLVLWFDDGRLMGDGGGRPYRMLLTSEGARQLQDDCLLYPAPFYVQRLVADRGARGVTPGQVLRAYVVDNEIVFWSERYRDRYTRPSDWIVNVSRGAKYRFLQEISAEATKIALRSAEVMGLRIGAVDLVRAGSGGPFVLEVDTDSHHMIIDRQFKSIPEYREFFNLDRYIAEALLVEPEPVKRSP